MAKRINPIWIKDLLYVTGLRSLADGRKALSEIDIRKVPPLDRPLLIFHGGRDMVVPGPREQVDYLMNWATGEKELKWYPEGEHCCANYFDEVIPYSIDWFNAHLSK